MGNQCAKFEVYSFCHSKGILVMPSMLLTAFATSTLFTDHT